MLIRFCEIGESFGTRPLGDQIREGMIIPNLKLTGEAKLIFDFQDVEVVSHSFADQCFGKLIETFGLDFIKDRTTFCNVNPFVSSVIKSAINKRMARNREMITH